MSPVVYREDESSAWGVTAIVLIVALFALLIGYFAWWRPSQINAAPQPPSVVNVQPSTPQPSSPTVIPVPVPGPQGPAGPAGAAGPAGPAGPAAPATPATPSDSGTTSGSDTGSGS